MAAASLPELTPPSADSPSNGWGALLVISGLFLVCRTPVMYHEPGGQDEDFYSVPGLTILQSGVPRLPHVPARNAESIFYRADEVLFAEPPLYFYWQAAFYACLPKVYGTARLASAVAGVIALVLIYRLAAATSRSPAAAVWAAALFSLSRWFYFPATWARPDMLAAMWGFAAVLSALRWERNQRATGLVRTGLLIGLGGLTHPFALVYAIEIAVCVALVSRGRQRLTRPLLVAAAAILTASLWGLLIVRFPDVFRVQFRNQFLYESDSSLWRRLVWPWESLQYHFRFAIEYAGVWQLMLTFGGLAVGTVVGLVRRDRTMLQLCGLSWGGMYLLCTLVGPHHSAMTYFVYPVGLAFVVIGRLTDAALAAIALPGGWRRLASRTLAAALLCSMLPGGGYRTLLVHLQHWNEVNYDAPRFARQIMETIPAEAVCVVDSQFTLDFVAAGRPTLLCQLAPIYFQADQFASDYLLLSRYGTTSDIVDRLQAPLARSVGVRDDPFACYCEIRIVKSTAGRAPPQSGRN